MKITDNSEPLLKISGLSFQFLTGKTVFKNINFFLGNGEFISIVGKSGSGKTTLLKCLCGILQQTEGNIWYKGKKISVPPENISLVFQDYTRSLFPWLTVFGNVSFAIKRKKNNKEEKKQAVIKILSSVGLFDYKDYFPWQLSGGMQQRVALARALISQPEILLLDEPFASVDTFTRFELENLLLSLWQRFRFSIIFVTHDVDEAVYLSDRIIVLNGTPTGIVNEVPVDFERPRDINKINQSILFPTIRSSVYNLLRE